MLLPYLACILPVVSVGCARVVGQPQLNSSATGNHSAHRTTNSSYLHGVDSLKLWPNHTSTEVTSASENVTRESPSSSNHSTEPRIPPLNISMTLSGPPLDTSIELWGEPIDHQKYPASRATFPIWNSLPDDPDNDFPELPLPPEVRLANQSLSLDAIRSSSWDSLPTTLQHMMIARHLEMEGCGSIAMLLADNITVAGDSEFRAIADQAAQQFFRRAHDMASHFIEDFGMDLAIPPAIAVWQRRQELIAEFGPASSILLYNEGRDLTTLLQNSSLAELEHLADVHNGTKIVEYGPEKRSPRRRRPFTRMASDVARHSDGMLYVNGKKLMRKRDIFFKVAKRMCAGWILCDWNTKRKLRKNSSPALDAGPDSPRLYYEDGVWTTQRQAGRPRLGRNGELIYPSEYPWVSSRPPSYQAEADGREWLLRDWVDPTGPFSLDGAGDIPAPRLRRVNRPFLRSIGGLIDKWSAKVTFKTYDLDTDYLIRPGRRFEPRRNYASRWASPTKGSSRLSTIFEEEEFEDVMARPFAEEVSAPTMAEDSVRSIGEVIGPELSTEVVAVTAPGTAAEVLGLSRVFAGPAKSPSRPFLKVASGSAKVVGLAITSVAAWIGVVTLFASEAFDLVGIITTGHYEYGQCKMDTNECVLDKHHKHEKHQHPKCEDIYGPCKKDGDRCASRKVHPAKVVCNYDDYQTLLHGTGMSSIQASIRAHKAADHRRKYNESEKAFHVSQEKLDKCNALHDQRCSNEASKEVEKHKSEMEEHASRSDMMKDPDSAKQMKKLWEDAMKIAKNLKQHAGEVSACLTKVGIDEIPGWNWKLARQNADKKTMKACKKANSTVTRDYEDLTHAIARANLMAAKADPLGMRQLTLEYRNMTAALNETDTNNATAPNSMGNALNQTIPHINFTPWYETDATTPDNGLDESIETDADNTFPSWNETTFVTPF